MNLKLLASVIIAGGFVATAALAEEAGDPAAGEHVFMKCRVCHQVGENAKNMVGPVLNGVVGRKAGTYPGYNYSTANKDSGITWTDDELEKYLAHPQQVVKGTKMAFAGLTSEKDINNVIAYLKQFDADGKKK